ncbi:MAG: STAS domain-containing protein [Planctomycetota bacterium]
MNRASESSQPSNPLGDGGDDATNPRTLDATGTRDATGQQIWKVDPGELRSLRDTEQICSRLGQLLSSDLLESPGGCTLNLDLATVQRISSEEINALIGLNRHCRRIGVRIVVQNVSESVAEVFRLTRLERVLSIQSDAFVNGRA